jgi:RNA-binding protein
VTDAPLSSKQRAHLRGLAHTLKPVHQIGKEGVTPASIHAIAEALRRRELLKLKVLEGAPADARATAHELAELLDDTHVVQVLGRTVTLYRAHPERPEIKLPR